MENERCVRRRGKREGREAMDGRRRWEWYKKGKRWFVFD
jgi:hypothetical protein